MISAEYSVFNDYVLPATNVAVTPTALDYVACPNTTITITINNISGYTFQWYDAATGGNQIGTGTSCTITKNAQEEQYAYVETLLNGSVEGNRTPIKIRLSHFCGETTDQNCDGRILFYEDFRGNSHSDPTVSPTDLISGSSDLIFNGVNPGSGNYGLIKTTDYPAFVHPNFDHTFLNDITRGYFMYIDPSPNQMNAGLYRFNISNLCDSTELNFTVWAVDLQRSYAHPIFEMQLLNMNTQEILLQSNLIQLPRENTLNWRQYGFSFKLPNNVTDIIFKIINKNVENIGNDWAIDDIQVTYCGAEIEIISPATTLDTTVCEGSPILFSAVFDTAGTNLSGRDILYQWQRCMYNSHDSTWVNCIGATSLSYLINNVSISDVAFYRLKAAEPAAMNDPNSNCYFVSDIISLGIDSCDIHTNIEDLICQNSSYNDNGFTIPANENAIPGIYTYYDTVSISSVSYNFIMLSLTVLPVNYATIYDTIYLGQIYNENGFHITDANINNTGTYEYENENIYNSECFITTLYLTVIGFEELYIYLPNAITPSRKEGINDYFSLCSTDQIATLEIYIYDRWGGLVFHSRDINFKWDGKVGGNLFENSIFYYKMTIYSLDGKKHQYDGSITVL